MAWTQADIDALDAAFKTGASSQTINGESIQWRSVEEYLRLRKIMQAGVAGTPGVSTTLAKFYKD